MYAAVRENPVIMNPDLMEYYRRLHINRKTVHNNLKLSDRNRKVTHVKEDQSYPDHPERFDHWEQLLCRNRLTGRHYWEVEWSGEVFISVSSGEIERQGNSTNGWFGGNDHSWSLYCSYDGSDYIFAHYHDDEKTLVSCSSPSVDSNASSSDSEEEDEEEESESIFNRVAVDLNCPEGTLSFYRSSPHGVIWLHTFDDITFTDALYPGFWVNSGSSVRLC